MGLGAFALLVMSRKNAPLKIGTLSHALLPGIALAVLMVMFEHATEGRIEAGFPFFLRKRAPVSGVESLLEERATLEKRVAELAPWVRQADWLLDLHSMHEPGAPLLLTGMQPRNLQLAKALGNPVHIVVDAGHKDGVRMRDYGRFGLPDAQAPDTRSLLIECGFHGDLSSRDVARDMCVRFLQVSGVVDAALLQSQSHPLERLINLNDCPFGRDEGEPAMGIDLALIQCFARLRQPQDKGLVG